MLTGKTVLVIGGTGSLGHAFIERAVKGEFGTCKSLRVLSRDEWKQSEMKRKYPAIDFRVGDVRNYEDVLEAMDYANIVINAAALKQVPSCEYAPYQAIQTNCLGMQNIVRAAREYGPEVVLTISTDKACKPTTVMGMTKALEERITIAANLLNPVTSFFCCRYGNVLESRGSVIPLFREQIRNGGPVTVTVPEMTRFLLTLDQAVDTMAYALKHAQRGEIIVPRAPSARIIDIALEMCAGLDIEIKVTGIRPAEKLHEIMVSEEEALHTVNCGTGYMGIQPMLPELVGWTDSAFPPEEYSSRHDVLTSVELRALLTKHGIIV